MAETDLDVVRLGVPSEHSRPDLAQSSLAPPVAENFGQERHEGGGRRLWNIKQLYTIK